MTAMAETAEVTVLDFKPDHEMAVLELYKATPELHLNTPVDLLDEDQRQYHLSKPEKLFLVAIDRHGELKGFIYVGLKHKTITKEKARILHLVVTSDVKGKGIANKLLDECERRLKSAGITELYSCSNVANKAMAKFLLRRGFSIREVYFRFEQSLDPGWRSAPPIEGFDDTDYEF